MENIKAQRYLEIDLLIKQLEDERVKLRDELTQEIDEPIIMGGYKLQKVVSQKT
jgi:hypothetical protein